MIFAKVVNGEIVEYNKSLPFSNETTSFGVNTDVSTMVANGYLPIVGSEPTYNKSTHKIARVWYNVLSDKVEKVYDVTEKSTDDIEQDKTQLIKSLTDTIQKHLDDTAIEYGYDSILSMCTYATSTDEQFRTQGQRAVEFRDAVWNAAIGIMNDVKSGAIETPDSETLIGMLPAF